MNSALINIDTWFRRNKLNLNPSKTRYMIFNYKTDDTKLVKSFWREFGKKERRKASNW